MQTPTVLGAVAKSGPSAAGSSSPAPPAGSSLMPIAQPAASAGAETINLTLCTETTCQRTRGAALPYE